jgi:pantetheine-phosphate adenylyltransferase
MAKKISGKKKVVIYPGTFDPITNGHLSLIERAVRIFGHLIIAVSANTEKKPLFSQEERYELVKASVKGIKGVSVIKFDGLLADLAREQNASAILRGLRAVSDFEFEFQMALMNRKLLRTAETIFLMPSLKWVYLSSTIIRDVASNNGNIRGLVPPAAARALRKKFNNSKRK